MTWFLVDANGYRYPLGAAGLQLGRAPENDIVLPDEEVSRRHAVVQLQGDEAWLHDLNSFNGVFVNGVRLRKPHHLRHGDALRLGASVLRAEWLAAPQPVPQPVSSPPPAASSPVWQAALAGALLGLVGLAIVFLFVVRPLLAGPASPGAGDRYAVYLDAINAVAFVLAPIENTPNANAGTAVVLSDSGRLLTAYSVVYDANTGLPYNRRGQALIGLRGDARYSGAALDRWYLARVVRADRQRDLAVLQIYALQDGSPLPNSFTLDAAPLGTSALLAAGSDVAVLSFPVASTGNDATQIGRSLAIGEGEVLGFLPDAALGEERGWMQSDIGLGLDNLGGLALNARGQLVGIYTGTRVSGESASGSLIRPIDLAEPLLAGSR